MNFSTIADAWREFARRREERNIQRRTLNAVAELPPHLLKDIGWPGAYERPRNHR